MIDFQKDDFNPILYADGYTVSGNCLSSDEGRYWSSYYLANRISPVRAWPDIARDDRSVMWGPSMAINQYMSKPVTMEQVMEADEFMGQACIDGGPLDFDYKLWRKVVKEHHGFLPIIIEGLPEGDVFYPHQPMLQVISLDKDFGEMAAHVEDMLVGIAGTGSARATYAAHLRQFYKTTMKERYDIEADGVDNIIDFVFRACTSYFEAKLLGLAHLLFFNGTDVMNAAFWAYKCGVHSAGKTILALAHRIVQSYIKEKDAYYNLALKSRFGSHVADCYHYKRAIVDYLIPLAKQFPNNVVIARPDSGDAVENALFACNSAKKAGLSRQDGRWIKPINFKLIEANTVTPTIMIQIWDALAKEGFHPHDWMVFGFGGHGRRMANRDTLSTAYKLNACGKDQRGVMKFSETTDKESFPGPVTMYQGRLSPRSRPTNNGLMASLSWNTSQQFVTYYNAESVRIDNGVRKAGIAPWCGDFRDAHSRAKRWVDAPLSISRTDIGASLDDTVHALKAKYRPEESESYVVSN